MQDSFLRLLGVVCACAGAYVYVTGEALLGFIIAALGVVAILKTTRLVYRQFGPWRPTLPSAGDDENEERRKRAEARMKRAAVLGPGARRSLTSDAHVEGHPHSRGEGSAPRE